VRIVASFLAATAALASFDAVSALATIKTGDKIPSINLHSGFPPEMVNVADYCKDKNVIMIGLPGAFTPTWSDTQVPGYLENQDALKAAGVDEVLIYCVNDAAVMMGWAADQKIDGSMIKMMGDPAREFTSACGMEMTHPGPPSVGIIGRCKRHAIHVVNAVVQFVAIAEADDDPAGDAFPDVTLAPAMLEAVESYNKVQA
jgi:2-Cys peroxiredoxin 5